VRAYVRSRSSKPALALTSKCQRADRRHSGRSPGAHVSACGMNGSSTAAQYAANRRLGSGREVVGVDDHRRVPASISDGGVQLVQRFEPHLLDAHFGPQRVVGRSDLLGRADEERVPGLGKETSVGEDLSIPVVGGVLEEDVEVMRLVTQPCQERRRCVERAPVDVGLTEGQQVPERLMEREHVAALDHRA
jgi:hypothetical protein